MKFKTNLKLYLFKDRDFVDLGVRVSDTYVVTYSFPLNVIQEMLSNWKNPQGGFEKQMGPGYRITVQHKQRSPRPERAEASYVRFSVFKDGITHNHRLGYDDMLYLERELFFQQNNQMYWD